METTTDPIIEPKPFPARYDSTAGDAVCPGCFDESCYDCTENPNIDPVSGQWSSKPSAIHGRRISLATPKQVAFLDRLLAERPALRDVENLWPENTAKLSKGEASTWIDQILKTKPEGQTTGATRKQADFIRSLGANAGMTDEAIDAILRGCDSPKAASAVIDGLKGAPKAAEAKAELEDAIYQIGDEIRKVYHTQSGQQVAKVWDTVSASWEYVGKRGVRGLTADHRMTLEEAKAFGAIYGICCNCSRTLTDETSIEEGIGPVCARRFA